MCTSHEENNFIPQEIIHYPQKQIQYYKYQNSQPCPATTNPSWSSCIRKHVSHGSYREAIVLYNQIRSKGVYFLGLVPLVLKACAYVSVLNCGKSLHSEAIKHGVDSNVRIGTSLVSMYAKCGDIPDSRYCKIGNVKEARAIFDRVPVRNLVNWNSLICGYSQNGFCEEALDAFGKMQNEGYEPDEVTVVGVLSACAQLSLLDVGFAVHGKTKEALEFFGRMEESNEKPDEITFLSVLSACVHGGFVEVVEDVCTLDSSVDSGNDPHYALLLNMYAGSGSWEKAGRLSMVMVDRGLQKTSGRSSLMLENTEQFHI
ncbi:hypothetical protein D5086_026649 [Populus alba]|uniref:Uncharacterized protein n=1 Tax=Populus alba TaxID=43335 RepID=A0ACC4B2R9_POPAL